MPLAGGTFTGDVTFDGATAGKDVIFDRAQNAFEFQDGAACRFGTGNDLAIYHDGSNSFISDSGTGKLLIRTSQLQLEDDANEPFLYGIKDGAVNLYYHGDKKFETTNAGGQISGVLYADGGRFGKDNGDYLEFTTDARADLVINGNNEFRFESDGDFHADGDVIAFSTTIASDERLKENIKVVPDALDKVEALRGVTFDWKRDGTPSAGVIAQEVQEVLPEAVKEVTPLKGGDSHLSVNYHALTSILIESVKELSARVKELEGK